MEEGNDIRLGVPELDVEHAAQLQLVRAVRAAIEARDASASKLALDRLVDYTAAHFRAEGLLMRFHGYPGSEAHAQEHEFLTGELRRLADSLADGPSDESHGIADRLEPWLRTHITTADAAFAAYLTDRRTSGLTE